MYKLGIIGLGKMGFSILNGITKSNIYNKEDIILYDKFPINNSNYKIANDINEVLSNSEIIFLAIKPQNLVDIKEDALKYNYNNKCIISILAGIAINKLEAIFKDATIVRAMPNTPALIGMGVATVSTNNNESNYYNDAIKIFSSIGKAYKVLEDDIDKLLPLNGSMPAYIYYYAKGFIEEAVKMGIDYEIAKEICCESMISSCNLVLNSKDDINTLINNVCSKGGTTIAGLDKLIDNGIDKSISECYMACFNRSKELGK